MPAWDSDAAELHQPREVAFCDDSDIAELHLAKDVATPSMCSGILIPYTFKSCMPYAP